MIKMIRNEMRLRMDELISYIALLLGGWIFGVIVMSLVLHFGKEQEYFYLGTLMAWIFLIFIALIYSAAGIIGRFHVVTAFGRTRKTFFPAQAIVSILFVLAGCLEIELLMQIEKNWYLFAYPDLMLESSQRGVMLSMQNNPVMAYMIITVGLSNLIAVLILKYGKKAFWVVWVFWMIGSFTIPPILSGMIMRKADSYWGRIGIWITEFLKGFTYPVMAAGTIAICLLLLGASYLIVRKQQVNM